MKALAVLALVSFPALSAEYIVKYSSQKALNSLPNARALNVALGNFAVVKSSDKSFLANVKSIPGIEYAEENITYKTLTNDADYKKQWGLENTGRNSGSIFAPGVKGVDINAIEAWKITTGSKKVKIAVIDTGVDYTHPDLKNQIMINEAEKNGTAGVDDDGNGYIDDVYGYDFANTDADPMDGHGHGTHCAGVIGAQHDTVGIAGVMAKVQILPVKFLGDDGSGSLEGAILAIDYAMKRGVNVMSNSWGGGGFTQSLLDAIKAAEQAGIVFVAAAGNESNDNDANPSYPASYETDNMISVGAMDGRGKKASFSNFGAQSVHVFAPGVDIYSSVAGGGYKKMSGTSMATPHVAGVVGLMLSKNSNLSPIEIRQLLMDTSVNTGELRGSAAGGYANAAAALK
ncbi:MAG: S8 family serine peptidase [Bacteriovoracaceae bacterium]|nr:S8 family serine peptidase [Bacteriovoracaceae bacterium]